MTMNAIRFDTTLQDSDLREAFQRALDEIGVTLTSSKSFERALARTREAAERSSRLTDDQLREIVDDVVSGMEVFQDVADSFR
jgi:hypothetical protein